MLEGKKILSFTKEYFYKNSKYFLSRKYDQFNTEVTDSIAKGELVP